MKSLITKLGLLIALISNTTFSANYLNYDKEKFSEKARRLMHDYGERAIYSIKIHEVRDYLTHKLKIQKKFTKLLSKHIIPGKEFIRHTREKHLQLVSVNNIEDIGKFFLKLKPNTTYTYVITENRLYFTESVLSGEKDFYKDFFSKHYFISGLRNKVYFGGEFHIYKSQSKGRAKIVFDNSSGTYRPSKRSLSGLLLLLQANFSHRNLDFAVRSFDE